MTFIPGREVVVALRGMWGGSVTRLLPQRIGAGANTELGRSSRRLTNDEDGRVVRHRAPLDRSTSSRDAFRGIFLEQLSGLDAEHVAQGLQQIGAEGLQTSLPIDQPVHGGEAHPSARALGESVRRDIVGGEQLRDSQAHGIE